MEWEEPDFSWAAKNRDFGPKLLRRRQPGAAKINEH